METQSVDNSTFRTIYNTYVKKVYQVAYHYSKNHHTSQDVTQAVFMKFYMNKDNINMDDIEAWLMVTARNIALDESVRCARCKKDQYRQDVEDIIDKKVKSDKLEDTYMEIFEKEERVQFVEEIYKELYKKNPKWHKALWETYIQQKPQKEVAKEMGISLGALQIMIHRAKKWIKQTYHMKFEDLDKA